MLQQTRSILSESSCLKLLERPMESQFQSRVSEQSQVELRSYNWSLMRDSLTMSDCRFVRISGPKIDVVNAMFFPSFPSATPIFAAELISFGGKARIAFVDLQWPCGVGAQSKATKNALQEIRQQALVHNESAPEWATSYSSGAFYYHRGDGQLDLTDTFQSVYVSVLEVWKGLMKSISPAEPNSGAEALDEYKRHHSAHTPGGQFLGNVFGEEWSHNFLNNFLYK
ncbi:MAG: hypothetical protein P1V97_21390 [Planctomycetota bacterium]|nr:hypothetical protein [Planctomycetota bacterium]